MKRKKERDKFFLGPVDWLSLKGDRETDIVFEKQ